MCVMQHVSVITQLGESALTITAREGRIDVVVELMNAGTKVNMQDKVCQCTLRYVF